MANKNSLYEFMSYDRANIILEKDSNGKDLFMKGIFIQGDLKNRNGRVYPMNEINNAVKSLNEQINAGSGVLGELDHPEELQINLDRASHVITEMWMEGANGMGKLKLIPTPCGEIAKTLLESGVTLGVSSRGSGNVDHQGKVSDFEIVTVDIVAQPSAPGALPKPVYESLYNMRGGNSVHTIAEEASHGDKRAKKYLRNEIVNFINELKK